MEKEVRCDTCQHRFGGECRKDPPVAVYADGKEEDVDMWRWPCVRDLINPFCCFHRPIMVVGKPAPEKKAEAQDDTPEKPEPFKRRVPGADK